MTSIKLKRLNLSLLIIFIVSAFSLSAQIPEKPATPRLVNDFANIFSPEQVKYLEDSLSAFSKKTSNQILIVTVNDLNGMDKAQMAYEIGQQWGVGDKQFNNGLVILIKPKNTTRGEAFIATGYGLEGALPDAACKSIIENEMIPQFKKNRYFEGVANALSVIEPIAAGEYSFEKYKEDQDSQMMIGLIFILIFVGLIILFSSIFSKKGSDTLSSGKVGAPFIGGIFLPGGGGSSNSGSGFGGGGGFGGFGGGGFGGGGAGGSW